MTLGWYTILEFTPSLWGAMISSGNCSYEMIRRSGQCIVNLPTVDQIDTVSRIGNSSGDEIDKFDEYDLTKARADYVDAPTIAECHASFECRLYDDTLVASRNFFIFEIVKARVAERPVHPKTLHYIGGGAFITAGNVTSRKALFTKVT
ncbi:flavin reductase (plasmid) [Neorhizobium sp. NCHU2750]|nr:flavin reductase [Neorhizobium sp. NCHU2750]